LTLCRDLIDPRLIAEEVAAAVKPTADNNNTRILLELTAAPASFATDPVKLRQCLLNLMSNAAKFTKNGVIRLNGASFQHENQTALRFIVADTGIGISQEQQGRLFKPFAQGDESITREYGGTGLGLMLTRNFAQLLGGDVSVKSAIGAGAAFTLWMPPLAREAPETATVASPDAPLVVVVDDEPDAQQGAR
jgi:signal transduction histidine kinase